jgi:hypothetical protein
MYMKNALLNWQELSGLENAIQNVGFIKYHIGATKISNCYLSSLA